MASSSGDAYVFASDNTAPMTPEALAALGAANELGCLPSYGEDDAVTGAAVRRLREVFETECEVFFVFSGTAANALALSAVCQPYHSVFCHAEAHVEKDEAAAPEFFGRGMKLHLASGEHGKVSLAAMAETLAQNRGVHSPQPRAVTVTQATELGTVYTPAELGSISEFARRHGLVVHMDGARFANAVASLGCPPADLTWRAGVDVLSLGGTKNGVALSEAVVFFNKDLARDFGWRRKQGGHLASKMRFLAAPWLGALDSGNWLRRAAHANACARRLAAGLLAAGHQLAEPVEANGVFVRLDPATVARIERAGWHFYKFLEPDVYRLMCSWRTTEEEVGRLLDAVGNEA